MSQVVYWGKLACRDWVIYVTATDQGVCRITLPTESFDTLVAWIHRHLRGAILIEDESHTRPYTGELAEYLAATREQFTLPLDLHGTPFQKAVWRELTRIPYGATATYSDVAYRIGRPTTVRAVAAAIAANPLPFVVPCHRVIGKNGHLTDYRGGLEMKASLLRMEQAGCRFDDSDNRAQSRLPYDP